MPLDPAFVSRIHTRLLARYGSRWLSLYPGFGEREMSAVRDDWADVLHGVTPQQIAHALAHLPVDNPPNAMQFCALCVNSPYRAQPPLLEPPPSPPADPERLKAALEVLKQPKKPLAWAYEMQDAEKRGAKLTIWQREAWRLALAVGPVEEEVMHTFTPIDPACLPPGMRPPSARHSPSTQNPFIDEGDPQ